MSNRLSIGQPPLVDSQIIVGGIYQFNALPRCILAPQKGIARVTEKHWTRSHGWIFYLQLQQEDGTWLFPDKAYARVSLYDVEFYPLPEKKDVTDCTIL